MLMKPTRWQSKKYRDAAKGQNCTMRLSGCSNQTETVVLAHRNGSGMGTKASDHDAADMCRFCHDVFDRRIFVDTPKDVLLTRFEAARLKTLLNRIERGILK